MKNTKSWKCLLHWNSNCRVLYYFTISLELSIIAFRSTFSSQTFLLEIHFSRTYYKSTPYFVNNSDSAIKIHDWRMLITRRCTNPRITFENSLHISLFRFISETKWSGMNLKQTPSSWTESYLQSNRVEWNKFRSKWKFSRVICVYTIVYVSPRFVHVATINSPISVACELRRERSSNRRRWRCRRVIGRK